MKTYRQYRKNCRNPL